MPEPFLTHAEVTTSAPSRPFPWYCPNCRRKEVRRVTIPYQCQLEHKGQPLIVAVSDLAVPRCGNCGELVFDYEADDQINRAFQVQIRALGNGANGQTAPGDCHGDGHSAE
jgi:hypothetical protein